MRELRRLMVAATVDGMACSIAIGPASGNAPAKKKVLPLDVLVTNDDGFGADGIDALVEALRDLPKVKVTVVAPATNQSGTADKTSPTPPPHSDETTKSGYKAVAVSGFPADAVKYALEDLGLEPDVVISGINAGQNLGAVGDEASGTVGAAKTAVRAGFPALAVSQGFGEPPDFPAGVREAIKWVKKHRRALSKGNGDTEAVVNLNIPTCNSGDERGVIEVPLAPPDSPMPADSDCQSTLTDPKDDNEAFANGFTTLSEIEAD